MEEYLDNCVEKSRIVTFLAACLIGLDRYLSLQQQAPIIEPPTSKLFVEAMRVVMRLPVNQDSLISVRLHAIFEEHMQETLHGHDIPHAGLHISVNLSALADTMSANELVAISCNFQRVSSFFLFLLSLLTSLCRQ